MSAGQRRLAAIMVTDMVGYSALVQTDEAGAMRILDAHRQIVRPIVEQFHGREVKTLGDGFLIEFGSALEAMECAVEIQRAHSEHNRLGGGRSFSVRIGIHVGDVLHEDGDVYGDAVNIASRIEPLADPGGIVVSQSVFDQVGNKVGNTLSKLPPQRLKNIQVPFELYKVVLPWEKAEGVAAIAGQRQAVTSDVKRVKSGIESLDREIGGGLPERTVTLVYGAPKTGKSVFSFQFLMESVKAEVPCLYVMTDYATEELTLALSTYGWNIRSARESGMVRLIDMTSTFTGGKEIETSSGFLNVVSTTDLTGLMMALGSEALKEIAREGRGFRVVLDSLTPLFIYNPPIIVAKFLRQFALKMKGAGASAVLVTYVEGSVDPQSELIIKSSVDNLVRLDGRELYIEGMLGTPRIKMAYRITGEGMKVGF